MIALAYILINTRTGQTRVMDRAALDAFDFGPYPSAWRVC